MRRLGMMHGWLQEQIKYSCEGSHFKNDRIWRNLNAQPDNHSKMRGRCTLACCGYCHWHNKPPGKSKGKTKGRMKLRIKTDVFSDHYHMHLLDGEVGQDECHEGSWE